MQTTVTEDNSNEPPSEPTPAEPPARRLRLCVIVTVDITLLNLCRGRFEYLTAHGFDITAVCAPTPHAAELERRGIRLVTAPLTRSITPLRDLVALWRLYRFLRRERFDIVEVSTPKAALVGSMAARLAHVPCLIHFLRGLVYEHGGRVHQSLLKASQTIPCILAHEVISVSQSTADQAVRDRVCAARKIRVLGHGSSNGVDLDRFKPATPDERRRVREAHGIPADAVVAGFVGRMTRDKGIHELVGAFQVVAGRRSDVHLLIVGKYEDRDRPSKEVVDLIASHERIHHVGWQESTAAFLGAMDMLVLPTYREGFGTVLLEAAAMGLPIVVSDIVGCRDAVQATRTALLVPPRDTKALVRVWARLAGDEALRARLGAAGRRYVESYFAQEKVWAMQAEALRAAHARTCSSTATSSTEPPSP